MSGPLTLAFLSKLCGDERRVPFDLEARLTAMIEQGRAAWPAVPVAPAVFAAYVAEHIRPDQGENVDDALRAIHPADLYVASACVHGVAGAVDAVDAVYLSQISRALSRLDGAAGSADDMLQIVRTKLFVADGSEPPRIVRYSGRSPLSGWIWTAAWRTGKDLLRRAGAQARADAASLAEELPPGEDPELDYLKARCRVEFREAFQAAIASLTPRERTLLEYSVIQGLSHDSIARIFRVTQPTITRQLAAARESISKSVHRTLCERLRLRASEVRSIARLIRSELNLSLGRWLADDVAPKESST